MASGEEEMARKWLQRAEEASVSGRLDCHLVNTIMGVSRLCAHPDRFMRTRIVDPRGEQAGQRWKGWAAAPTLLPGRFWPESCAPMSSKDWCPRPLSAYDASESTPLRHSSHALNRSRSFPRDLDGRGAARLRCAPRPSSCKCAEAPRTSRGPMNPSLLVDEWIARSARHDRAGRAATQLPV